MEIPEWAAFKFLFKSRLVAAAVRDHPLLAKADVQPGQTIPMDLFCSLPQAVCSTDGSLSTSVDAALNAKGRRRKVVLTMPHFHAIALAIAKGQVIGSLPVQFAVLHAPILGLDIYEFARRVRGDGHGHVLASPLRQGQRAHLATRSG